MEFKSLAFSAFDEIELLLQEEWKERRNEGNSYSRPTLEFKIVGQAAILLSTFANELTKEGVLLTSTSEIDAITIPQAHAWPRFHDIRSILERKGIPFDDLSDQIWMPSETEYTQIYPNDDSFTMLTVLIADSESVLISKAVKAPKKNKRLLEAYFASGLVTQRFKDMAKKYNMKID